MALGFMTSPSIGYALCDDLSSIKKVSSEVKVIRINIWPSLALYSLSLTEVIIEMQVRSNHERLVAFGGDSSKEKQKDSPLKLKSTAEWKQRGDSINTY